MSQRESVKTITYLKSNAAELVREVNEDGRTVTITQNGEAKVVVMDVDTYDRWRSALALMKLLAQGEADVQTGRTVGTEETFERARKAIFGIRNWRELIVKPYRIIYRIDEDTVNVLAVLDGRRDLQDLLLERLIRE